MSRKRKSEEDVTDKSSKKQKGESLCKTCGLSDHDEDVCPLVEPTETSKAASFSNVEPTKPEYDWGTFQKKPLRHLRDFMIVKPPKTFYPLEHVPIRSLVLIGQSLPNSKSSSSSATPCAALIKSWEIKDGDVLVETASAFYKLLQPSDAYSKFYEGISRKLKLVTAIDAELKKNSKISYSKLASIVGEEALKFEQEYIFKRFSDYSFTSKKSKESESESNNDNSDDDEKPIMSSKKKGAKNSKKSKKESSSESSSQSESEDDGKNKKKRGRPAAKGKETKSKSKKGKKDESEEEEQEEEEEEEKSESEQSDDDESDSDSNKKSKKSKKSKASKKSNSKKSTSKNSKSKKSKKDSSDDEEEEEEEEEEERQTTKSKKKAPPAKTTSRTRSKVSGDLDLDDIVAPRGRAAKLQAQSKIKKGKKNAQSESENENDQSDEDQSENSSESDDENDSDGEEEDFDSDDKPRRSSRRSKPTRESTRVKKQPTRMTERQAILAAQTQSKRDSKYKEIGSSDEEMMMELDSHNVVRVQKKRKAKEIDVDSGENENNEQNGNESDSENETRSKPRRTRSSLKESRGGKNKETQQEEEEEPTAEEIEEKEANEAEIQAQKERAAARKPFPESQLEKAEPEPHSKFDLAKIKAKEQLEKETEEKEVPKRAHSFSAKDLVEDLTLPHPDARPKLYLVDSDTLDTKTITQMIFSWRVLNSFPEILQNCEINSLAELESCFQNQRDSYILIVMSDILKCLLDDPNFIGKKEMKHLRKASVNRTTVQAMMKEYLDYMFENAENDVVSHLKPLIKVLNELEFEKIKLEDKVEILYFLCDHLTETEKFRNLVEKFFTEMEDLKEERRKIEQPKEEGEKGKGKKGAKKETSTASTNDGDGDSKTEEKEEEKKKEKESSKKKETSSTSTTTNTSTTTTPSASTSTTPVAKKPKRVYTDQEKARLSEIKDELLSLREQCHGDLVGTDRYKSRYWLASPLTRELHGILVESENSTTWHLIHTKNQLRKIMRWLNPKGVRENALLVSLEEREEGLETLFEESMKYKGEEEYSKLFPEYVSDEFPRKPNDYGTLRSAKSKKITRLLPAHIEYSVMTLSEAIEFTPPSWFDPSWAKKKKIWKLDADEAWELPELKDLAIQFLEKLIPSKTRGKLNDAGVLETKEKILNANTYSAFALQLDLLKASFDIDVIRCRNCGSDKKSEVMLLCDRCDSAYHTYCLYPKLNSIPKGNWYCSSCKKL